MSVLLKSALDEAVNCFMKSQSLRTNCFMKSQSLGTCPLIFCVTKREVCAQRYFLRCPVPKGTACPKEKPSFHSWNLLLFSHRTPFLCERTMDTLSTVIQTWVFERYFVENKWNGPITSRKSGSFCGQCKIWASYETVSFLIGKDFLQDRQWY